MSSSVLTRTATARQQDLRLKATLVELQLSKKECEELIREREESEVEVNKVVQRNTDLKNQLAELHSDYLDSMKQCQQLQSVMEAFDSCAVNYEITLRRISDLEIELNEANKLISELRAECESLQATETQSLFQEMVGSCSISVTTTDTSVIDLTKDDSHPSHYFTSTKKLKRYIKVKKFIKRTQRLTHARSSAQKNVKLIKERSALVDKLNQCSKKLQDTISLYDNETQRLQLDISKLEFSLRDMSVKYEGLKQENSEHVKTASRLVDMCQENEERFYSLINNHMHSECSYTDQPSAPWMPSTPSSLGTPSTSDTLNTSGTPNTLGSPSTAGTLRTSAMLSTLGTPNTTGTPSTSSTPNTPSTSGTPNTTSTMGTPSTLKTEPGPASTVIYSDELGAGLGSMMSQCLRQKVRNNCLRGASIKCIVDWLAKDSFSRSTTLIVILGNSVGLERSQMGSLIRTLSEIERHGIHKIILCALPYSKSMPYEHNIKVSGLNSMLYNVTCYSSNYQFFDTNKFVKSFKLFNVRMNILNKCKMTMAKLLAYNIEPEYFDSTGSSSGDGSTRAPSPGGHPQHLN
jgi:hypothetical protein